MNTLQVPEHILETAKRVIRNNKENWPDDDWFSLGWDYDLNLYEEGPFPDGYHRGATIYPVVGLRTQTGGEYAKLDVKAILTAP